MLGEPLTLAPGNHVCCVVASEIERTLQSATWAADGLAAGEKVVYIESDPTGPFVRWLDRYRVDWRDAASTGQLLLLQPRDAHLGSSAFDLDQCESEYGSLVDHALGEGYSGVRVSEDAGTAMQAGRDQGWLREYESRLESICESQPMSRMCFYDRRIFDNDLTHWAGLHASLSAMRVAAFAQPGRITLAGELDVANVELVTPTLRKSEAQGDELVVDLQALSFIDLEGTKHLVELTDRSGPSCRVKLVDPPWALSAILDVTGWADEFDLTDTESVPSTLGSTQ